METSIKVSLFACISLVLSETPTYIPPNVPRQFSNQERSDPFAKPNVPYGTPNYNQPQEVSGDGYQGHISNGGYQEDVSNSQPPAYNFEYRMQDPQHGNDFGHQESRQGNVVQGKYFTLLPDGRKQIVDYVVDSNGYNSRVTYEGTTFERGFDVRNRGGAGDYQGGGYQNANGFQHSGGHSGTGSYLAGGYQNAGNYQQPRSRYVRVEDY